MIGVCTCSHPYQDRLYGYGRRVFNGRGGKASKPPRCTVCSSDLRSGVQQQATAEDIKK